MLEELFSDFGVFLLAFILGWVFFSLFDQHALRLLLFLGFLRFFLLNAQLFFSLNLLLILKVALQISGALIPLSWILNNCLRS